MTQDALRNIIRAWEATKPGNTTAREIQRWLVEDMKPAIDAARSALLDDAAVKCEECAGTGFRDKDGARLTLTRTVCGKCGGSGLAALTRNAEHPVAAIPSEEPLAWAFELATWYDAEAKTYSLWDKPQLSFTRPSVPAGSIRNLTPLFTSPAPTAALLNHFKAMQAMATAYLMPETYVDREGRRYPEPDNNHTENIRQELRSEMAKAFANDMVYMLDGPEERAALKSPTPEAVAPTGTVATLRNQIKALKAALRESDAWVRAALQCKDWHWDDDQREAAIYSVKQAHAALSTPKEGKTP